MQTEAEAAQRRRRGRRRGESGQSREEPRGNQPRSSEEELSRFKDIISIMQREVKQAGGGQEGEKEEGKRGRGRDRGGGGGGRRRRRAASEGGDGEEEEEEEEEELRWRVNQLEKEKLELTSRHNQELCQLQAGVTRLRSCVERGEAQREELQYQLSLSHRDRHSLSERSAELLRSLQQQQRARDITLQDHDALQQEVEQRDKLIQSLSSDGQRLQRLLQDQAVALEESERRMTEVKREREEAEEEELRRRAEREEASNQRLRSLELNLEAERVAHMESKFNSEVVQLRVRDLEAAVAAQRGDQQEAQQEAQRLREQLSRVETVHRVETERSSSMERSLQRLQAEYEQCRSELSVALETERKTTSDLTERLQEEERRHDDTHTLLEQIRDTLQQHNSSSSAAAAVHDGKRAAAVHDGKRAAAVHDGKRSAEVLQLLKTTLVQDQLRREETERRVRDQLGASERLQQENWDQSRRLQECQQTCVRLEEELSRLRQEKSDWSTQNRRLQEQLEGEREEREREKEKEREEREREKEERKRDKEKEKEEREREKEKEKEEMEREKEREKEEREREREKEKEQREREKEREKEEKEKDEMEREKEREKEEMEREKEREKEQREREKEERMAEVRRISEHFQKESKARLSFLYSLYQRLLAGCVLLPQPHCILGNFTWKELCDVITEQADALTSDLQSANDKVVQLQRVCDQRSACVRELQRGQECVLRRLEESVRRREEAWSGRHTHAERELQVCRSQCDSLRDQASSLTSDLSRRRAESSSLLSACALLAGALTHDRRRLRALSEQKRLLSRRLAERELLEEEVRSLAAALGGGGGEEGEEEEEEEEQGSYASMKGTLEERGRRRGGAAAAARRRWRRSVWAVMAVRRWRSLTQRTTVLIRLEGGGAVCGASPTATRKDDDDDDDDDDEGRSGASCVRWLRSKRLCAAILSSMSDLQGALTLTDSGSAPPDAVMSAARFGLSRLLRHLLDQSDEDSVAPPPLLPPPLRRRRRSLKAVVSTLQQHFLLFSQRLHSAEVERRSLRLEAANLKRGLRREREDTHSTRFHSVCVELREALSREQEAQTLIQEQTNQLLSLQLQRRADTQQQQPQQQQQQQQPQQQQQQALAEARHQARLKERSLRILGKYLSGVQKEKKQLEERLQRAEEELRAVARRRDQLISYMKTAETSYKEVRETLVQSRPSLSARPRPLSLLLPKQQQLELSGAESIMGDPEVAACQTLLSVVSQVCHSCASRIDWLEQEVAAHRGHVTALRCELQDACLRDNQAFVPVTEFPETFPLVVMETLTELSPAPSSSKLPPRARTKKKSSRAQVKSSRS